MEFLENIIKPYINIVDKLGRDNTKLVNYTTEYVKHNFLEFLKYQIQNCTVTWFQKKDRTTWREIINSLELNFVLAKMVK